MKATELRLVRPADGKLSTDHFTLAERMLSQPQAGEVLVANLLLSVDPYMRQRLRNGALDTPLDGDAIGRVLASGDPALPVGALVRSLNGLRTHYVAKSADLMPLSPDPDLDLAAYMHVLGMTGFTAYGGLLHIGALKSGDCVFVSAAAGAVGSIAAQIAKLKGAFVIGSTGRADKAAWLTSIGVDHVINYRQTNIADGLDAAGRRIDVYFDNVGGATLDAALVRMNTLGRVAICGMISGYDGTPAPVSNLSASIYGRLTLRGFIAADFWDQHDAFQREMTAWLKAGQIKAQQTLYHGISESARALVGLFNGDNLGKALVQLAD